MCDQPLAELTDWVRGGRGYRGVVLATAYAALHPGATLEIAHAVGLAVEGAEACTAGTVVAIDP